MCGYPMLSTPLIDAGDKWLPHAPQDIPECVAAKADELLPSYIWIYPKKKKNAWPCHCTACGATFDHLYEIRHKAVMTCPDCGKESTARHAWRSRSTMFDEVCIYYWSKSPIDPQTVVCTGYWAGVNWAAQGDPAVAPRRIHPIHVSVYKYGKGGEKINRHIWLERTYKGRIMQGPFLGGWHIYANCDDNAPMGIGSPYKQAELVLKDSFFEAIKQTPFARVWCEELLHARRYTRHLRMTEMALIAKYPCMEYLIKVGQMGLVMERMRGPFAPGAINWNGKTAQSVLHLNAQQLSEIKKRQIALTGDMMGWLAIARRYKVDMTLAQAQRLARDYIPSAFSDVLRVYPGKTLNISKFITYVEEHNVEMTLRDLADYWRQCRDLQLDATVISNLFPPNFQEAHAQASTRLKQIADKVLNERVRLRAEKLIKKYTFSACGLALRPFESADEIIREGSVLHHCVGMYVDRYTQGRTILCKLRWERDMNTPFHTVEFSAQSGQMVQCRGYKNRTRPEDEALINAFWDAFKVWREKRRRTA